MLVSPQDYSTYTEAPGVATGFAALITLRVKVFVRFKGQSLYNPA